MSGIITLVIALILQTGYTVYCLVSKSRNEKAKLILRVSALGVMLLLIFLRIYKWGFRWIPLFILLIILTVSSLITFFIRRKSKPFSKGKSVLTGLAGAILLFLSIVPAIIFPQYKHPVVTGEYEVITEEYTYTDASRVEYYKTTGENRQVNVAIWYPENGQETYPLIVFSHGFNGVKYSNESTFVELASHGYVVCSIDHPYNSFYTKNDKGEITIIDKGYMQEYEALGALADLGEDKMEVLKIAQKWTALRVADVNFVIDTILNSEGGVYDLVDHTKIGVFGHSLGAVAATGIPRVRQDIGGVINLDGPMWYELIGVENGSYSINPEPYPVPILSIYSQYLYDNGIQMKDELYIENRLVSATAPASYEVVFAGSQHLNFTDLPLLSPILANMLNGGRKAQIDKYYCIETMNQIVLEFFDCYLKDIGTFDAAGFY